MQIRPAMLPRLQKPSPNNSTSSGPSPRPARYGCAGSSFSAKESGGLIGSSEASEASLGAGSGSAAGFDPHGDEAERLLDYVPPWRTDDVIYLDLSDLSRPIGFNVLEREPAEHRALVASNIVSIFKHFWSDAWGARSEYLLLCSVLAILDYPDRQGDVSLLGVQRMMSDPEYRARVIRFSRNAAVCTFWDQEFAHWPPQFAAQALSPLQNKLGALLAAPAMRLMLGQATSTLRLAAAMDERKIVISRLPKGLIGEDNTNLTGSLLVNAVQHAAMRRAACAGSRARRLPVLPRRIQEFHDRELRRHPVGA